MRLCLPLLAKDKQEPMPSTPSLDSVGHSRSPRPDNWEWGQRSQAGPLQAVPLTPS